ncbi:hypothetical protein [Promicromonospora sp. NPDC057488]|uniref:hypothetical protein n=1 Tax=Promicromonospora sp. NPDC057488 TaxID=3346147 RepID=UPI00367303DA
MNSRALRFKLWAMESKYYWRLRSQVQATGAHITGARLAMAARVSDSASLIGTGSRALFTAILGLVPPVVALLLTQSTAKIDGHSFSLPVTVNRIAEWLSSPMSSLADSGTLPTAAIEVAGVFVAIYFATVTFVVSTSYKDATRRLRNQVIRLPESRWYVVFFTQAVVYTALALALPLINQTPTHITLVLAGLAAALVVLSFGRIWITLFVLLEPTSLFPQILRNLNRWVHRAYKLGKRQRQSALGVRRANEKVRENLEALADLVTLILDREHERAGDRGISASYDPRIATAHRNLRAVWEGYARRKHVIRTLSNWNPSRFQAKDWFLTSHSEVSVALATGTSLPAAEVVDELWFERHISDLIERLQSGRDIRSIESILRGAPSFTRTLGALGQFEELRLWVNATTFAPMASVAAYARERGTLPVVTGGAESSKGHLTREQHFALPSEASAHNLSDFVMLESLNACLGHTEYFGRMTGVLPIAATFVTVQKSPLVASKVVLQLITNLRMAIAVERKIERSRVTPDSAIGQLVARALATETVDQLEELTKSIESEIWTWVLEVGEANTWAAGAALGRAFELREKLGATVRSARALLLACEVAHVEKDDRWPDTNIDAYDQRVQNLGEILEMPIAKLASAVDSAPDSYRPDHFGWAYYTAHENLLRRVLDRNYGDADEFRQKLSLLYWTGDVATQRLLATVRRHDQSVINSYVAEPYLRFMQLSGIALVLAAVTKDDELFSPFDLVWTYLLSDTARATLVLGRAAATLSSESAVFALTPGGLERSGIETRANRVIEDLGVPRRVSGFDVFENPIGDAAQGRLNLTEGARILLREVGYRHFEGVFYAHWLRARAVAAGATPPTEVERYMRGFDFEDADPDA